MNKKQQYLLTPDTAHHEAGHAVAALHGGFDLRKVSMGIVEFEEEGVTEGFARLISPACATIFIPPSTSHSVHSVEKEIVQYFAGPIAEARFTAEPICLPEHPGSDLVLVKEAAATAGFSKEYVGILLGRARRLIQRKWPDVEIIARALLREGELSKEQVLELVDHDKVL